MTIYNQKLPSSNRYTIPSLVLFGLSSGIGYFTYKYVYTNYHRHHDLFYYHNIFICKPFHNTIKKWKRQWTTAATTTTSSFPYYIIVATCVYKCITAAVTDEGGGERQGCGIRISAGAAGAAGKDGRNGGGATTGSIIANLYTLTTSFMNGSIPFLYYYTIRALLQQKNIINGHDGNDDDDVERNEGKSSISGKNEKATHQESFNHITPRTNNTQQDYSNRRDDMLCTQIQTSEKCPSTDSPAAATTPTGTPEPAPTSANIRTVDFATSAFNLTHDNNEHNSNSGGGSDGTSQTRYLEMMVHNVSHTDLVLCLGIPKCPPAGSNDTEQVSCSIQETNSTNNDIATRITKGPESLDANQHALCKPRFSAFEMFCQRILHVLKLSAEYSSRTTSEVNISASTTTSSISSDLSNTMSSVLLSSIMSFPRYERSDSTRRFTLVTPRPSRQSMLPVGINLSQLIMFMNNHEVGGDSKNNKDGQNDGGMSSSSSSEKKESHEMMNLKISLNDLHSLRLRGKDVSKLETYLDSSQRSKECNNSDLVEASPSSISYHHHHHHHPFVYSSPRPSMHKEDDKNAKEECTDENRENTNNNDTELHLEAVFFPLISSLLRRWSEQIIDKYPYLLKKNKTASTSDSTKVKQVLILVTGVGTPRNWTHSMTGNSTQACAEIMECFIKILYPHVTVVRIHSEREIFRYDGNIMFAQKELLPCIDAYRDAHAKGIPYPDENCSTNTSDWSTIQSTLSKVSASRQYHNLRFDPDWKQTFSVTLSFADGAPARTHAIQSALRPYRPVYFHFWQLKTFWHDSKICDDDIEVHAFESMETSPAMEINKTSFEVQKVIDEMKSFQQSFIRKLNDSDNDIKKFWLRKSKKPVLAVLLVNKPGEGLVTYRGTNMEVSMPTGSLCAERNVIGTAFAADPGLRREQLMMVAVLSLPLDDVPLISRAPSPPPDDVNNNFCTIIGNDDEKKVYGPSPSSPPILFSNVEEKLLKLQRRENIRRSMSVGSFASIIECDDSSDDSWIEDEAILDDKSMNFVGGVTNAKKMKHQLKPRPHIIKSEPPVEDPQSPNNSIGGGSNTPLRKIRLYADDDNIVIKKQSKQNYSKRNIKDAATSRRKPKSRTVLVHSSEDLNPLNPCGACNEWLKKIAESNPHFKVITFTDADCNGVYVSACQE